MMLEKMAKTGSMRKDQDKIAMKAAGTGDEGAV